MTRSREGDLWVARMAAFGALVQSDALAVVLRRGDRDFATFAAQGLSPDAAWSAAAATILERAFLDGSGAGTPVALPLADGRIATRLRAVPVTWDDQRIAAVAGLRVKTDFSAGDLAMLGKVASLVAVELAEHLTTARAQRLSADRDARVAAARALRRGLEAERDPATILDRAAAETAALFGADGGSIMLLEGDELAIHGAVGLPDDAPRRTGLDGGIAGHVARTGECLLLTGPVAGERYHGSDAAIADSVIVPLRDGDRTIGVLSVKHRESPRRFSPDDPAALATVGAEIGAAYRSVAAIARAEDDRQQAIALFELSRIASRGSDVQLAFDTAIELFASSMRHDVVALWAAAEDGFRLRASHGWADAPLALGADEAAGSLGAVVRDRSVLRFGGGADGPVPTWLPTAACAYAVLPLDPSELALGALVVGRREGTFTDPDLDFAATAGEYFADLLRREAATEAAGRAAADERKRIAQEIHDSLAQELTGVVLSLEAVQRAFQRSPDAAAAQLAKAIRESRGALADVRHYMGALRNEDAVELGLPATVVKLVADLRRQSGLDIEMAEIGQPRDLGLSTERAVMRIIGEALRNVVAHANAQKADVTLRYDTDAVVVSVDDDGNGFDVEKMEDQAAGTGHYGLIGMRERAEAAGGTLAVRSAPGHGSSVEVRIPCAAPEPPPPAIESPVATRPGILMRLFGR